MSIVQSVRAVRRRTVVVLLIAIMIAAAVTAGVAQNAAAQATKHCAILPDSIGLYTGNPVTRMGYQIGTISSIDPRPEGVRVEFSVQAGQALPIGVRAVTRSKSVLADRSMELVDPPTRSGRTLDEATCIGRENTYTPASISEVAGSAADLLKQLQPKLDSTTVEDSITQIARSVDGLGPDVARLMRTASSAATDPEQLIADIGTIVTTMAPLSSQALDRWSDLESLVTKLPDATRVAGEELWPGAQRMIQGLVPLIHTVSEIQTRYGDDLWPIVGVAVDVLHVAAVRVPQVQKSLTALPVLADSMALAARSGRSSALRVTAPNVQVPVADPARVCAAMNSGRRTLCRVRAGSVSVRSDVLIAMGGER